MFKIENKSLKELLIIVGISGVLFWLVKPRLPKDKKAIMPGKKDSKIIMKPMLSDDELQDPTLAQAYNVLCIYIDANNNGESKSDLAELKADILNETGFEIVTDSKGRYGVKDDMGNDVLKYN